MRYPGFLRTFGSRLGAGLADELLDRWFPPPPGFWERFSESVMAALPGAVEILSRIEPTSNPPTPADVARAVRHPAAHEPEGIAFAGKTLGEFTCPKCAGHTWGTMGFDENGTYLRYCTNGLETAYGEFNPNTVKTPCQFQWKATEDHLYFAKPSADDVRRSTETVTCAPASGPEDLSYLRPDLEALTMTVCNSEKRGENVVAAAKRLLEEAYEERVLLRSVLGKRVNDDEPSAPAAARLITEADAFIKQQSDKITELMLDNVFPAGKGEIGFMLTDSGAKKLGVAYAEGAPPMRVSLVLDGWQWSVRLGPARVGGTLIPLDWAKAEELLRDARNASSGDQTAMAQKAAGGVA